MKYLIISLIFFCCCLSTAAQQYRPLARYDQSKGLSSNFVRNIIQDDKGFLWVGTLDGLNRFDGTEFKTYYHRDDQFGIANNYIRRQAILPDGRLVIGTANGLSIYNSENGLFENRYFEAAPDEIATANYVNDLKVINGLLLVSTKAAFHVFDSSLQLIHTLLPGMMPMKLHAHSSGFARKIFRWNEDFALIKFGEDVSMHFLDLQKLTYHPPATVVSAKLTALLDVSTIGIHAFPDGSCLILRHATKQIYYYDALLDSVIYIDIKGYERTFHWGADIYVFGQNRFFVPLAEKGGLLLSRNADQIWRWESILKDFNGLNVACKDKSGNYWIGSDDGFYQVNYLSKWGNEYALNKIVPGQYKRQRIWDIFTASPEDKWIGTNEGLFFYQNDDRLPRYIPLTTDDAKLDVLQIFPFTIDTLWLVTTEGLLWVNTHNYKSGYVTTPGIFDGSITLPAICLFEDSKKDIWIGMAFREGLVRYNRASKKFLRYVDEKLRLKASAFCEKENGDLLLSSYGNLGLQRYERNSNTFSIRYPEPAKGFHTAAINKMQKDNKGDIWLGTNGNGLVRFVVKQDTFINYSKADGLASNYITDLLLDADDQLWVATYDGLNRIDLRQYQIYTHHEIRSLNYDNYFISSLNYDSLNNQIIVGGFDRWFELTSFNTANAEPFGPLYISELRANDSTYYMPTLDRFQLPYHKNHLGITFSHISFQYPPSSSIYYRLKNVDTSWMNTGNRRTINFANLGAGKYHFESVAKSAAGKIISPLLRFDFDIAPPFYTRWWFMATLFILAISLVYLFYRFQLEKFIEVQRLRNSISSDLHDDIGATLSNISMLSYLSEKTIDDRQKLTGFLGRIREEVLQSSQSLEDIIWTINPKNDKLQNLTERMQQYALEMLEGRGIEASFEWPEHSAIVLNMQQRRDLFFIFKEIIHNICKHSGASKADIQMLMAHQQLSLTVKDDGGGFLEKGRASGNGLRNMRMRAQQLRGSISITSRPGLGTTVFLNVAVR